MLIFCNKNADISKIKVVLILKCIFSEIKDVCVFTYQISSFWHNLNEFETEGVILPPPQNEPLKNPPRLGLKLKFRAQTNSHILNWMLLFTLSVLNRKYPPWANLVQKLKIV